MSSSLVSLKYIFFAAELCGVSHCVSKCVHLHILNKTIKSVIVGANVQTDAQTG